MIGGKISTPKARAFPGNEAMKPVYSNYPNLLKSLNGESPKTRNGSGFMATTTQFPMPLQDVIAKPLQTVPTLPQIQKIQQASAKIKQQERENSHAKLVSDHISVAFFCPVAEGPANEFLLRNTDLGLAFFETPTPGPLEPWRVPLDKYLKFLKIPTASVQGLLRLDRWAVPGVDKMASHAICSVKVTRDQKETLITHLQGGMWLTLPEIINRHQDKKLSSSDVIDTIHRLQHQPNPLIMGIELSFMESFLGIDPTKTKKSGLELLVQAAKLGRNEQEVLYMEFLKLSVPYLTLGMKGFTKFMKQLGWDEEDCKQLFRTFDMQNKEGLSFRDFLCGIAATEPVIQHGGPPAEIRCRYIFKYYDRDSDSRLSFQEFKTLMRDIRRSRNLPDDPAALQVEAEKQAKLFGDNTEDSLGLTEFLTCVGQLRFRGTSHLLRSPHSVLKYIQSVPKDHPENVTPVGGSSSSSATPKKTESKRSRTSADYVNLSPMEEESTIGGFAPHREILDADMYEIASHSVTVRKSGTVLDVHSIWDIEHSGIFGKQPPQPTRQKSFGPSAVRLNSVFNFHQNGQVKEMLSGLKYFERALVGTMQGNGGSTMNVKAPFSWGDVDRNALGSCLLTICGLVKDLLLHEPRLLELSSPVYILGDIHGNFPDLLCFEKALWRLGPLLTPASFLFLGDYVDRGDFGVEVVSYLFSHKLTAPTKFNLLRGNHEIREVQHMFTFYKECIAKFGEKLGKDIFSAVNDVFDAMPLAAVIDKKIFCAHGGIPPPWIGGGMLNVIKSIPCPLPRPEEQSKLAWELMWSDPMHAANASGDSKPPLQLSEGFGPNLRRGTAHVFTEEALEAFLKRNKLSHVVRAHEVQQAGFQVQLGGKLLTVFSSSKYCGGSNEAACILADKLKLRTIRLDTS